MAKSSKLTAGRKPYEPVFSLDSPFAGLLICGCLVKLKRGFEGTGRVAVVSLAGVGRKERVSREATLAPLAILLLHASADLSCSYLRRPGRLRRRTSAC